MCSLGGGRIETFFSFYSLHGLHVFLSDTFKKVKIFNIATQNFHYLSQPLVFKNLIPSLIVFFKIDNLFSRLCFFDHLFEVDHPYPKTSLLNTISYNILSHISSISLTKTASDTLFFSHLFFSLFLPTFISIINRNTCSFVLILHTYYEISIVKFHCFKCNN